MARGANATKRREWAVKADDLLFEFILRSEDKADIRALEKARSVIKKMVSEREAA